MLKPFSKALVLTAMLIAFIGQALAYTTMSCEMPKDLHDTHMAQVATTHQENMNHHEGMNHDDMHNSAASDADCCGSECVCPENACHSISFVTSEPSSTDFFSLTEVVIHQSAAQPHAISKSLYRPPIFA